jgi:hypothetical protein
VMHCKKLCKCYNVAPPNTTIKGKKERKLRKGKVTNANSYACI